MAALNLTPEDFAHEFVEAWPDNIQAIRVFISMDTQWRTGMNGSTGLDYAALSEVWRRLKVPPAERDDVFDDLRVLEGAALRQMHGIPEPSSKPTPPQQETDEGT
jgi:hypothetical protein